MVSFPHCKINLGLRILRKREDGYHDLETVFYPVPVNDVLEVISRNDGSQESGVRSQDSVRLNQTGLPVDGNPKDNLCLKAYYLLKKEFPLLPSIQMHLHKNIPMGAGLGGGSSDGAFALKLLNEKFVLNLNTEQLTDFASELGSDCPFFIQNKPCFGSGRGEELQPIELDLSIYSFLIISPGIHISTALAFSKINPAIPAHSIKDIIRKPLSTWKDELFNDFEESVFDEYPEIRNIKNELYKYGAIYASMTGSGSSVFGLFPKNQLPEEFLTKDNYRIDRIA
jgi:4-diphosphocytidyl-2-C-methyl-D-erythritol kinase